MFQGNTIFSQIVSQNTREETLPNSFYKPRITVTPRSYTGVPGKEMLGHMSLINTGISILHFTLANQLR